jgi:hypothetical protein
MKIGTNSKFEWLKVGSEYIKELKEGWNVSIVGEFGHWSTECQQSLKEKIEGLHKE